MTVGNGILASCRDLTGMDEDEDAAVETEAGEAEFEVGVFTAPEAWSSRTIASTMALSFESSINEFLLCHCEERSLRRSNDIIVSEK